MSTIVDRQTGITFNDSSNQQTVGYTGFRNRIINGGFLIDQRNSGASTTPTADATYTLDRWQVLTQAQQRSLVLMRSYKP